MTWQSVTEEVIEILNGKGWDTSLFDKQHQLSGYICHKCKSVCFKASELGCHHSDSDIYLYCEPCLSDLIDEHMNKCPINSHENPIITPSRAVRREISKFVVHCPYSQHVSTHSNNMSEGQVIDTIGADEKKGNTPPQHSSFCLWKGTLNDLIHNHLTQCSKKNDATLSLKLTIKKLTSENEEYKQQIIVLQKELTAKDQEIARLKTKDMNERKNEIDTPSLNFTGIYKLVSSENFDKYLQDGGYGYITRKIATTMNSTLHIVHQGNKFHYTTTTITGVTMLEDDVHGNQTHPWIIDDDKYIIIGETGHKIEKKAWWNKDKTKLIAISKDLETNLTVSYHVYFDENNRFCLKRINNNGVAAIFRFAKMQ